LKKKKKEEEEEVGEGEEVEEEEEEEEEKEEEEEEEEEAAEGAAEEEAAEGAAEEDEEVDTDTDSAVIQPKWQLEGCGGPGGPGMVPVQGLLVSEDECAVIARELMADAAAREGAQWTKRVGYASRARRRVVREYVTFFSSGKSPGGGNDLDCLGQKPVWPRPPPAALRKYVRRVRKTSGAKVGRALFHGTLMEGYAAHHMWKMVQVTLRLSTPVTDESVDSAWRDGMKYDLDLIDANVRSADDRAGRHGALRIVIRGPIRLRPPQGYHPDSFPVHNPMTTGQSFLTDDSCKWTESPPPFQAAQQVTMFVTCMLPLPSQLTGYTGFDVFTSGNLKIVQGITHTFEELRQAASLITSQENENSAGTKRARTWITPDLKFKQPRLVNSQTPSLGEGTFSGLLQSWPGGKRAPNSAPAAAAAAAAATPPRWRLVSVGTKWVYKEEETARPPAHPPAPCLRSL